MRPIEVLLYLAKLTPITFRSNISKAKFAASRRSIPCSPPVWGQRRIPSLSTMRFCSGLFALRAQRSLTLVPCEQDSIVRRVVEDRARRRAKIAMRREGCSRSGGGRRHLAKGRQWARRRSATSTGVGLRGSGGRRPSTSSMKSRRLRLEMSPQGWRTRYRFRFRHLSPLHSVVRDRRRRESPWTRFLAI